MANQKKKKSPSETRVKELTGKDIEEMSLEEMQAAVAKVQLLRETTLLAQSREDARKYDEKQITAQARNEQRQAELRLAEARRRAIQKQCRHRRGGQHQNILRGDGKPCVTAMKMLDGYTVRLSCQRCRKTVFLPNPQLEKDDPKAYADQMKEFEEMFALFEDGGMDIIRGPEFMFAKNGVPFVPARV